MKYSMFFFAESKEVMIASFLFYIFPVKTPC